jgi:nucleotide-binding universal stress UspA family protein
LLNDHDHEEVAMKILLAVDGSPYTVKAAKYLTTHLNLFQGTPELYLFHVKLPIPMARAKSIVGKEVVERYYKEEAVAALAAAEKIFSKNKVPFKSTYKVGDVAKEIQCYAEKNDIDLIVMGSHGLGTIKNIVMGSITTKVLAMTEIPVLIVR